MAFDRLPRMLPAVLESPPLGVVVRGDLAVEIGFERLSEVQEEILWLCEAAYVPCGVGHAGARDADADGKTLASGDDRCRNERASGVRHAEQRPARGPVVSFLDDVLHRMRRHQENKRAMLPKLAVAALSEPAGHAAHAAAPA